MRILTILGVFALLAFVAIAVFMRFVPMRSSDWHVDPANVTPPSSPNFVLRVGEDAPIIASEADAVARSIAQIAQANGWTLLADDPEAGLITYVIRSRIFGFPDAISLKLVPFAASDDTPQTRVEIFSRSRFGYDDLGANAARVSKLLVDLGAS